MNLELLQKALRERGIEGWLFYDFEHRDPIAYRVLDLPKNDLTTRRWYYMVPAQGVPTKLVHSIESTHLDSLPGEKRVYTAWQEHRQFLQQILEPFHRLAMQYSPNNQIPYISRVDAGTVELVRSFGKTVISSADLVQLFEARFEKEGLEFFGRVQQGYREIARLEPARVRLVDGRGTVTDVHKQIRDCIDRFLSGSNTVG